MAREITEVWVVVPPKMTGDIQWPIQVYREEQVARWACEENVRVGVASKVERLPLLTPHDAAVLEAAEDVYSDYDESELSTLPTSVRHLWNAVRARRAANAGGET